MKQKSIMLLLTYSCNLRCSYCYEPKQLKHRMTFESAKKYILEQVSLAKDKYDSFEIQFMGGEPLMEFSLIQKISYWLWDEKPFEKQYILFAQTNGTLLNDSMKSWFVTHKDQFYLALSMDGTNEMQNTNRSDSSSLVDTDFFVKNWPSQNVKMTISPQTVHKLSEGVIFLHKIGFKHIAADLAMGSSVKWTSNDLSVYRSELSKLIDFYIENPDLQPFSMLRIDPTVILDPHFKASKTCSCGEDLVCVDWDGKTYACHLFSPISVSKEKAEISNKKYDFTNHSQFTSNTCSGCKLNAVCNKCYGMNYICTNDVTSPSAFHCNAYKIRFFASCKLFMRYSLLKKDKESIERIKTVINTLKIE